MRQILCGAKTVPKHFQSHKHCFKHFFGSRARVRGTFSPAVNASGSWGQALGQHEDAREQYHAALPGLDCALDSSAVLLDLAHAEMTLADGVTGKVGKSRSASKSVGAFQRVPRSLAAAQSVDSNPAPCFNVFP